MNLSPLDFGFIGYTYYISDDKDLVSALNRPSPTDCWRIFGKEPIPPRIGLYYIVLTHPTYTVVDGYAMTEEQCQYYIDDRARDFNIEVNDSFYTYWPFPLCHDEEQLA